MFKKLDSSCASFPTREEDVQNRTGGHRELELRQDDNFFISLIVCLLFDIVRNSCVIYASLDRVFFSSQEMSSNNLYIKMMPPPFIYSVKVLLSMTLLCQVGNGQDTIGTYYKYPVAYIRSEGMGRHYCHDCSKHMSYAIRIF